MKTAALYLTDVCETARDSKEAEKKISAIYPEWTPRHTCLLREADRLRSLVAELLLYATLGPREIVREKSGGKPYIAGGPHFSVSHSGNRAMLAVDDEPVGVDIEKWVEDDYTALAQVAFHKDERILLERAAIEGGFCQGKIFFDIWTLKESYLKMLGSGLSRDPTNFAVKIEADTRKADARVASDPRSRLRLYDVEGYSAALCSLRKCPDNFEKVAL
ncbi:MAG: 4'-phosphopantetheinyl transferase superfamily protein [Synergistaceae bacterium]|nr:4'-phosphopantetheinyl transferase superfamily protein [Synergistaceae bacterium]